MANLCLKKPSKRMTCRKKYKIARKIREYNRKKRKESKKLMNKSQKKLIYVPNICPFKEEILKNAAEYKKQKQLEQEKNRKALLKAGKSKPQTIKDIAQEAQKKQIHLVEPEANDGENDYGMKSNNSGKQKSFYREFQKVVASADVILEVVDARDPLGTRCPAVEKCVRDAGEGKRLVLVLNKSDLVPREILDKWIRYLRKSVPAIPFKSSTQSQSKHLGRRRLMKKQEISSSSVCVGAEGLTSLLANYTRNKGIKTAIRVGVVGLPNVGKSSLINSLKRSRSCKVGGAPGITRSLQEVQLDSKIKLLDSPGLALARSTDPHAALKNAVLSTDLIEPAQMIIKRANKEELMKLYLLPNFDSDTEFLAALARRYGRYKRKGIVDMNAAAKILVDDWNRGKIPYYVQPPEEETSHDVSSSIVTSEVAEFDLDSFDKQVRVEREVAMDTSESEAAASNGTFVVVPQSKKKGRKGKKEKEEIAMKKKEESLMQLEGNMKLNKMNKLKMKKEKKQKARTERAADKLAHSFENVQL